MPGRASKRMGWIALAGILALYAGALWWSPLNQDEGWYLYAARQVAEGRRLYADFAFTQGPVMPRVYAWWSPWIRSQGVAAGRAVTALFGLLALGICVRLAVCLAGEGRERRETAALIALLVCGWNVYHVMFTTVVKTYALCAVFWTGGMLAWVSVRRARAPVLCAAAAGALLALAAGTRLSAAMAIPPALVWAAAPRSGWPRHAFASFLISLLLVSWALWFPSARHAPEGVWFALVSYHTGRASPRGMASLAYRAGFLSRMVQAFFPALLLAAWPRLPGIRRKDLARRPYGNDAAGLWAMLGLTTLVHGMSPFPYDDYQVFLFPVLAALAAAGMARWSAPGSDVRRGGLAGRSAVRYAVMGLVGLHVFGSPVWQDWAVSGRDRIWWHVRSRSELAVLRETARRLRATFPEARTLLTQDLYLAVETGWTVPPGLELGPFSYAPDLSDEDAAKLRVLNRAGMKRVLSESNAPVAAFSGYGLSMASPSIRPLSESEQAGLYALLAQRYTLEFTLPSFGQAGTPLQVFRLAVASGTASEEAP